MIPKYIKATTIPDAWFQSIDKIISDGRKYVIDHGSYRGQQRWELDFIAIHIIDPGARPLVPEVPEYIPPPTDMGYVMSYAEYLFGGRTPEKNEQYTYADRVTPQMNKIITRYIENGFNSNQECIAVATMDDIELNDPPCLRQIDTKIVDNAIHFYCYFRSWDLWGGFPSNLAALRLMQEYMAECIGVSAGEMIAVSKGLHLYDFSWKLAQLRVK